MKKSISKIIACIMVVLTLVCSVPVAVFATDYGSVNETGSCGAEGSNVTYTLYEDGTLVIAGNGKMKDFDYCDDESPFTGNDSIKSVIIEDGVTSIGDDAFRYCDSLTSVTIGDGVTSIGDSAFRYCHSLTSATIGDGVTSIGDSAFCYCESLTSVTIPNSVTSIGWGAFSYCGSLTSLTIPNSVTSIEGSTFRECYSLTSVTIPDGVTSIGYYAFCGCGSLTSVTIGDSVTSIGDYAFNCCYSLTSITVDESNKNYSSDVFGVLFNKDKTELIQYPTGNSRTEYTIPNSVTSIGNEAFYDCDSLTSVTIGDGVTSIGDSAFCDDSIMDLISSRGIYRFTDEFFNDFPDAPNKLGKGTGNMMASNVFACVPNAFMSDKPNVDAVRILGLDGRQRAWRWIERKYIQSNEYLDSYNVVLSKVNGSGKFGETLTMPLLVNEGEGATDTFISIGIAETPLTIDLCNEKAMLLLLKELLSEYNNNQSSNHLVSSITKLLDDTVYNENSNAICYYKISRKMVSMITKTPDYVNASYYNDL